MSGTFRSFAVRNYRIWASGSIVSNVGTWMQRTAQDWIVLAQLTDHDAASVGIVLAFQFAPQVVLLPLTGLAADRIDRRRLIMTTQALMAALSLGLGILAVTDLVRLWHVYVFAFLFGSVAAFDSPARQTFVSELVDGPHLSNAIALNTTSFNIARMIGPAVAGILIVAIGTGWVFVVNAATYVAVLVSLFFIRVDELDRTERRPRSAGDLGDGVRYLVGRPDQRTVLIMIFLLGTFGASFQIFIPTMTLSVFDRGAGAFGLLSSLLAGGSVVGALLVAGRQAATFALVLGGAVAVTMSLAAGAVAPTFALFAVAMVVVGMAAQTFATAAFSVVQLTTDRHIRGRVLAILLAVGLGGLPIGAPITGWVCDAYGPRWAMALGAGAGLVAVLVGAVHRIRHRHRA